MKVQNRSSDLRKMERIVRTPPISAGYKGRKDEDDEKDDRKKDKRSREDRKRKKEHRSRSKSKDHKKHKDRKNKREKEKDKHQKFSKEKDIPKEKSDADGENEPIVVETYKKQRRNPKFVSDRKKGEEVEYSISDTDSDDTALTATKRAKIVNNEIVIESEVKPSKKRAKVCIKYFN